MRSSKENRQSYADVRAEHLVAIQTFDKKQLRPVSAANLNSEAQQKLRNDFKKAYDTDKKEANDTYSKMSDNHKKAAKTIEPSRKHTRNLAASQKKRSTKSVAGAKTLLELLIGLTLIGIRGLFRKAKRDDLLKKLDNYEKQIERGKDLKQNLDKNLDARLELQTKLSTLPKGSKAHAETQQQLNIINDTIEKQQAELKQLNETSNAMAEDINKSTKDLLGKSKEAKDYHKELLDAQNEQTTETEESENEVDANEQEAENQEALNETAAEPPSSEAESAVQESVSKAGERGAELAAEHAATTAVANQGANMQMNPGN